MTPFGTPSDDSSDPHNYDSGVTDRPRAAAGAPTGGTRRGPCCFRPCTLVRGFHFSLRGWRLGHNTLFLPPVNHAVVTDAVNRPFFHGSVLPSRVHKRSFIDGPRRSSVCGIPCVRKEAYGDSRRLKDFFRQPVLEKNEKRKVGSARLGRFFCFFHRK